MTLERTFREKMGEPAADVSAWYARAHDIAQELGGEPGQVGLWSCGDRYIFPDGSAVLVLAGKIF